jgi:hypothetical protein
MVEHSTAIRIVAVAALTALAACGGSPALVPVESLTISRVMGQDVEVPPLLPQSGSLWPTEDTPRGTIGNPDAGLRQNQPMTNEQMDTPPRVRRGSSTPPYLPPITDAAPGLRPIAPSPAPVYPAPSRADGRVIPTPQGSAVTTGGGPGYSTYTTPEGASGIAIPQGGTTTLLQDGTVRQVPTPR